VVGPLGSWTVLLDPILIVLDSAIEVLNVGGVASWLPLVVPPLHHVSAVSLSLQVPAS